jgi:hypothetical protein
MLQGFVSGARLQIQKTLTAAARYSVPILAEIICFIFSQGAAFLVHVIISI